MEKLSNEQKLEIGHMLREGVSLEGIQVIVDVWMNARVNPSARYASYIEYGKPPIDTIKMVEGSISPIIDETHQLTEERL